MRSQHIYKLLYEQKYTPEKNTQAFADNFEAAVKEILRLNLENEDI